LFLTLAIVISPLLNKCINPLEIEVNRDYVGYVPRLLIARNGNFEINTPKLALEIIFLHRPILREPQRWLEPWSIGQLVTTVIPTVDGSGIRKIQPEVE